MNDSPYVEQVEQGRDVVVVRPVGDFDIDGTETLRRGLAAAISAERSKVVVDLSATTFLDSMALGVIIGGSKRAQQRGGWLRLVAPSAYVRKVLRVTSLDTVYGVFETVDEAIDQGDPQILRLLRPD